VRDLAARTLVQQGYTLLKATNGEEALRLVWQNTEKINLVLTDIVMPYLGGHELAEQLRVLRPNIKGLFTSGYTDNVLTQNGILEPKVAFINKPFSPAALAYKVREVLDMA